VKWPLLWLALALGCDSGAPAADRVQPSESAPPVAITDAPAPVPRLETSDLWLDLIAQRPSATVHRDGRLVVDMGMRSALKHLALAKLSSWELGVDVEDRRAALVIGRTAALDLPLDGELAPALHPDQDGHPDLAVAITLRALVPNQTVTVLWNEQVLAHLGLSGAWERRTLSLPTEVVRAGENRLRLHFRRTNGVALGDHAAAIERIELGSHAQITTPPPDTARPAFAVISGSEGANSLELAPGTGLAFYFEPPRRARLELDVAGTGGFDVLVSTTEDHASGRAPSLLSQEALRETGQHRSLDLGAWGGLPIRVELRMRSGRDPTAVARLARAKVAVERAVPLDRRSRGTRDVIVVTVEGARADEVELGGRPPLDALEALMAESLVFERAYAVSPAAVPSHAAWLSSVVPPAHLTVGGTFVADAQTLIPELLERSDYFRVAIGANGDLSDERGLVQGFDDTRIVGGEGQDDHARAVLGAVEQRLRGRGGRWFVLADLIDPQAPYEPPRELLGEIVMPPHAPLPHLTPGWIGRVHLGRHVPDARELAWVHRLYRGELQMVSTALGEFVDFLRAEKRFDDAILVFVGVHGEELAEHGGAGHGYTLYEESLRVPLLIHAPAVLASGRVTAAVDLIDLAPTLADLLGIASPAGWQGESLLGVIDDPEPPPRLVVAYLGDGTRAAIVGDAKLVLGPGLSERFFDLQADPGETTDALVEGGVALRIVRTALAWQLAHEQSWRRARWGTGANLRAAFALDQGM
jgi:arylsulfatase A-like enzyme